MARMRLSPAAAIVLFWSVAAFADDLDRARLHDQAARSYYAAGDFRAALREFETAYRYAERPSLLYNIAQCWDRLGDVAKTIEHLERYLTTVPDAPDRSAVESWLANLRTRAGVAGEAPPPPPPPEDRSRVSTWIAAGTAAAAGIGGGVAGIVAKSDYDQLYETCRPCPEDRISEAQTPMIAANVLFGVAGAAALTALVLWFVE
jgi:tetratricopeptide (TPR) repeat protein